MSRISHGTQHIETKITNLLKPLFAGNKKNFLIISNLIKNWEKIVGKKYVKLCYPKSINFEQNKTHQAKLTIAVYNSAVGFALENNSEFLLEKIATLYGYKAIHRIIIKQENKEFKDATPKEIKLKPKQEEDLQESLKNINNRELAETLARLGRDVLGRK